MAADAPSTAGCVPDVYGSINTSKKYWNAASEKEAMTGVATSQTMGMGSPRQSSAWSTQDGFVDPERDTSLECSQDIPCHSSWLARPAGRLDQDCDATCTSSSSDLHAKHDLRHKDGASSMQHSDQPAHCDAAAHPDTSRSKLQQPASPAEQQRLRAARQLDDLLAMIRNEQALERQVCPSSGFLEQRDADLQQPITPQMLMIVSSWLAEVSFEFSMQQETLFLAVGLLDRFLDASTGVPRGVLQLVAVACIMLAAKQDEVVHPTVQELTDIAANCFTTQDLLRMERILLDSLSWRVKTPTAYTFLHLFTQSTAAMRAAGGVQGVETSLSGADNAAAAAGGANPPQQASDPLSGMVVAKAAYLTELALLDYHMLDFKPSQIAAAALLLAQSWSPQGAAGAELHLISGFAHGDLQECMARLLRLHQYAEAAESCESLAPLVFIKEKYAQDCWLKASMQPAPQPASLQVDVAASTGLQPAAFAAAGSDGARTEPTCVQPHGEYAAQPMDICSK